jgi:hypothetical protein
MFVLMQDSSKAIVSSDVEPGYLVRTGDRCGQRIQRSGVRDALVRPVSLVEPLEFAQGVEEVSLVPDQRAVQQLVPAGLYPAFHDRVHAGHLDAAEDDRDARIDEDGVEQAGEFAVSVADKVSGFGAGVFEVHGEVSRGLGHPGGGRVCGGAQDADPAAGVFDDREDVHPCPGERDRLYEVACQQGVGLGT